MKKIIMMLIALFSVFMIGCSSTLSEEDAQENYDKLIGDLQASVNYSIEDFENLKTVEFDENTYGSIVDSKYEKDTDAFLINNAVDYYNNMINLSKDYSKNKDENILERFEGDMVMLHGELIRREMIIEE